MEGSDILSIHEQYALTGELRVLRDLNGIDSDEIFAKPMVRGQVATATAAHDHLFETMSWGSQPGRLASHLSRADAPESYDWKVEPSDPWLDDEWDYFE